MDIVVTTPHGDADIDIVAAPSETTLADLLRTVTGQAAPATARLDGRAVSTSRALDDIGLAIGSTIDTRHDEPLDADDDTERDAAVGLVQLTGRGAGTVRPLAPGRFLVGTASRVRGAELAMGSVDAAAFELEVTQDGAIRVSPSVHITGSRGADAPTLDGRLLDRELDWVGGHLHVGGRRFEWERPPAPPVLRRRSAPLADGTVPFRRHTAAPIAERRPVVDAVRDSAGRDGRLWQWRPGDRGAFTVAYGLHRDGSSVASVDLLRHNGVAIVGSERFTSALARTFLVELCTMHGPSTLDIVIASTPELVAHWNWARWLPHLRAGRPTAQPRFLTDRQAQAEWGASMIGRAATPASPTRLTLLVVDDPPLWARRASPLHDLLSDPPNDLRLLAVCADADDAPALCPERLVEVRPSGRLAETRIDVEAPAVLPELFGSLVDHRSRSTVDTSTSDISPALVEERMAYEIAHELAPLDDLDLNRASDAAATISPPTLSELITTSESHANDGARLAVAIGTAEVVGSVPGTARGLSVELSGPLSTIITAAGTEQHDLAVAAVVLGAAVQRRPDELAVVILGREPHPWHDRLPHVVGWARRADTEDPARLVHRFGRVAADRPELQLLVVVEHAFNADEPPDQELVTAMNGLAVTHHNVHVMWTGDHPASVPAYGRSSCGALAWLTPGGNGTVWFPDRSFSFVGLAASNEPAGTAAAITDVTQLVVRPSVVGRPPTALERRLARGSADASPADANDRAIETVARRVGERFGGGDPQRRTPTILLPPPLPTEVDALTLLEEHPGDAIPVGLIDRPERARNEPYWWRPGRDGSILAVGSPGSEMTSLIDVIALGVAARFSADDLHVHAIEPPGTRRRILESLPHTGRIADPDRADEILDLIADLRSNLAHRLQRPTDLDRPDILLMISDLGRVRRSLTSEQIETTYDQLGELVASGAWVGVNIVIGATRVDDVGPLDRLTANRLVGPMSDPDERSRLGVAAVEAADRYPRRCWSTAADRRVQLATPPLDAASLIQSWAPERPRYRSPTPIVDEGSS